MLASAPQGRPLSKRAAAWRTMSSAARISA